MDRVIIIELPSHANHALQQKDVGEKDGRNP